MYVTFSIIFLSMLIWCWVYFLVAKSERSYFNYLTPTFFLLFPTFFFFEPLYLSYTRFSGEPDYVGYFFYYSLYVVYLISIVVGVDFGKRIHIPGFFNRNKVSMGESTIDAQSNRYFGLALLFLFFAFILYAPILLQFSEYISSPRRIYELTRTGFGFNFYLSITASQLSIILALYCFTRFKFLGLIVLSLNLFLLILHGTKGAMVTSLFIVLTSLVYSFGCRFSLRSFLFFGMFVVVAVIALFYFTLIGIDLDLILFSMASYSDYTRNAILLFNNNFDFGLGGYALDMQFFSRIPRAIYPDKPVDFGFFALAKQFFPESFYLNQGVPSFGFGEYFADFGYASHFVVAILFFIKGGMLGFFKKALTYNNDVHVFIPFLYLCGIELLPLGSGWYFPEHVLLAFVMFAFLRVRVFKSYVCKS